MDVVNEPEVSKSLVRFYGSMAVFVAVLGVLLALLGFFEVRIAQGPSGVAVLVVVFVVLGFVEIVMMLILASIYGTRYVIRDGELILKATRLIGGERRIPLNMVKSAERTLIPFGFRLFGASFYGGYYYFPTVGRAFMVITNFRDGVLLRAEHGNYVITPSNPDGFIETIRKMKSREPPARAA